jgi:formylglycine-generating enzyme required for sulfatase activity
MRAFGLAVVAALVTVSCSHKDGDAARPQVACKAPADGAVPIAGGAFAMGQGGIYAEEGPVRQTTVRAFAIDRHEVTNRQFAEFVKATGYVTLAERPVDLAQFDLPVDRIPPEMLKPGAAVFSPPKAPPAQYMDWWKYGPGANWKRPYGPAGAAAVADEPVVNLGWRDMEAYARWKHGRLPTEAEWEFAARAGEPPANGQPGPERANTWQGAFPALDQGSDGFKGIAPAGCFAANAFGLYDMIGNVWEVTADFYRPGRDPGDRDNPRGPDENTAYDPASPGFPSHVMKGGSYLCAPNYCQRYRPAARQGRDPGLGANNVGFRLAYDRLPSG